MLNAQEALELTQQSVVNIENRKKEEETKRKEARLQAESEKNPARMKKAEEAVKRAAAQGLRVAKTGIHFTDGVDYFPDECNDVRSGLCEPHQELLREFEKAGYKVALKHDYEPDRAAWVEVVLTW